MIEIKNTRPSFSDFRVVVQTPSMRRVIHGESTLILQPEPGEKITLTPLFGRKGG